eukprot:13182350-Ditylum_brightwellii.AAC.1
MDLMLYSFIVVHISAIMNDDANYMPCIPANIHIDPLLAEYNQLANVIYYKNKPANGEILPNNMPGFRRKTKNTCVSASFALTNIAQVCNYNNANTSINNIPYSFGTNANSTTALHNREISLNAYVITYYNAVCYGINTGHIIS